MRGLPGSGKSTRVNELVKDLPKSDYAICSADNFPGYYIKGVYTWTPEAVKAAHKYCWLEFYKAIQGNVKTVIIDNTNVTYMAYKKYIVAAESVGYETQIEEIKPVADMLLIYSARNLHKVSVDIIQRMYHSWEEHPSDKNNNSV